MSKINTQQLLRKFAAANPAPTATPGATGTAMAGQPGQPKVAPVPGNSGNATTAPPGQPMVGTAPEAGKKGMADQGGEKALTKAAAFYSGMAKAAAEAAEDATQEDIDDGFAALGEALEEEGVDPQVFEALAVLEANGISLEFSDEAATKVAAAFDKIAENINHGHVLGILAGSPSAAIAAGRAPEGKKFKAGAKGYLRDVGHVMAGGVGGGVGGAAIGALAAKALKKNPRLGAALGGYGGMTAGTWGGLIHAGMKTHRETKGQKG